GEFPTAAALNTFSQAVFYSTLAEYDNNNECRQPLPEPISGFWYRSSSAFSLLILNGRPAWGGLATDTFGTPSELDAAAINNYQQIAIGTEIVRSMVPQFRAVFAAGSPAGPYYRVMAKTDTITLAPGDVREVTMVHFGDSFQDGLRDHIGNGYG